MTLSTPPFHSLFPAPAWTDARQRVEKYLRAHRVPAGEIPALAKEIVTKALMHRDSGAAPVTASIELAQRYLATYPNRLSTPPPASPPIRLTHMGEHAAVPALAPNWLALFQWSLLKFSNGLAITRSRIGATGAANR